jgi:hypothetical protein
MPFVTIGHKSKSHPFGHRRRVLNAIASEGTNSSTA